MATLLRSTSSWLGLALVVAAVGCDGAMLQARDAGRTMGADTTEPETDAGERPPIEPGPLPPDPMLEGIDRTRSPSCPAARDWVVAVRGRIVDEAGAPLAGALLLPCLLLDDGRRICLRPAVASAEGVATAILSEENRCVQEVALRVLLPETDLAGTYCAVSERSDDGVLVAGRTLMLLGTEGASALPPLGDENTMREVVFDGVSVVTTPNAIGADAYQALSARVLPGSLATDICLGDGTPMDMLITFAPEARVALRTGLPTHLQGRGISPGESVDLFVLGGMTDMLADGTVIHEGQWLRFGSATVAPDGTITTPAGAGLPHLGWLGVRRARR